MKHNNQLANGHFRKEWQKRVMTWLDQAGRKRSRRSARIVKAKLVAPRPTDKLRPAVHCQTIKHNTRLRAGRGFTAEEVKAAGLTVSYARSIGISVDIRRRNKCEESLELNKQRILAYVSRLVIFPKKTAAVEKTAVSKVALEFPVVQDTSIETARIPTDTEKNSSAYLALRKAWNIQRFSGIRAKRAAEKAEAEAAKK